MDGLRLAGTTQATPHTAVPVGDTLFTAVATPIGVDCAAFVGFFIQIVTPRSAGSRRHAEHLWELGVSGTSA